MEGRYWVEGNEGSRHGPADVAILREWIVQGRLQRSTFLVSEATEERLRADAVPRLFDSTVSGPPPVAPSVMGQTAQKRTGIIVLAVVMGACALCTPVLAAILFPVFSSARVAARRTQGLSNMKEIATGVLVYASDADDHFPPAMESADAMRFTVGFYLRTAPATIFSSVNPKGGEILGDKRLSGRLLTSIVSPAEAVMLHDSLAWDGRTAPVAFTDGHTRFYPLEMIETLMKPDPFSGMTKEQEVRP
ncbi:hypothetical protein BH11ARM2_BH11ARM2_00090 [soil metagenome]